jgi:hypothetical protein
MKTIVDRVAAFLACLLLGSNAIAGLLPNADGTAYDPAPAINHRWFLDTPAALWSASADTQRVQNAWFVNFAVGGFPPVPGTLGFDTPDYQKIRTYAVRLVRAAAPSLVGAASRKAHGGVGTFNLPLAP